MAVFTHVLECLHHMGEGKITVERHGELAGLQLTFVTSFFTEWYGWAAFHPETAIYDPDA